MNRIPFPPLAYHSGMNDRMSDAEVAAVIAEQQKDPAYHRPARPLPARLSPAAWPEQKAAKLRRDEAPVALLAALASALFF